MPANRQLTIVMYHYVRDLRRSRFPEIKGLSLERFRRQLDYIQAHYTPLTVEAILQALESGEHDLPPNPILLSFDDGYIDHFLNVFPLLDERRIQGCFFPPAQAILELRVLDVNKIHFLLASVPDAKKLLDEVFAFLPEFRSIYSLKSDQDYRLAAAEPHRYDPPEVTMLKRLLQRELPEPVRAEIVRRLFARHVTEDEAAFACELYMSIDQLRCLQRHGMHLGSHGYSHAWLNRLSPPEQTVEVDRALVFLGQLGIRADNWTMCYPYGGFNNSIVQIARARHCRLGFTAEPRIANLDLDDPLTLPRIDTNDLPS